MSYRLAMLATASLLCASLLSAATITPPAPLPPKPVTDTYFGTKVTDPYRYFEDEKVTTVSEWMKAQGRYTTMLLASIPRRAATLKRIAAFAASFEPVNSIQVFGNRTFYLDRAPGSDNFDLIERDGGGPRKLVDITAFRAAHGGAPAAINYFAASPDGTKVAVGISSGGSENANITVLDVASGRQIAGPIARGRFGVTGWSDDSRTLFMNLLADLPANAPGTEIYQNSVAYAWDMKSAPVALIGGATPAAIKVPASMIPFVAPVHGGSLAVAMVVNGTQNEREIWTVPAAQAGTPGARWTRLTTFADNITDLAMAGDTLYLLSHSDAPTFKVLTLKAGQPLSSARLLIAAQSGRLIEGIAAASDGLYVRARRGLFSELTRVPLSGGPEEHIGLPVNGSIGEMFTDPTVPGATLTMDSWTLPPTAYRLADGRFTKLPIGSNPAGFRPSDFAVSELAATAPDGTKIPLSYIQKLGVPRGSPLLLEAYGSYGISIFPGFGPRLASLMSEGINTAVCHVRGGGEFGEAWRLAGKDANKPNTWRDLIACGRDLVARGYTTPKQLFIMGGSAGGITMGRAMEEAPELFAGVLDMVPAANAVRQEFSPNGVPNIPEFGTVKNEAGFRNLMAMDSYLNVKDAVNYPPIMITTGLNDSRVASWEPAKLAARLQVSGTKNPVLLRVDEQAGHGMGSTKSQTDELYADMVAFIHWQAGTPGWKPTLQK